MISDSIMKDSMSKSKVDPCGVCCLSVKANSILFLQCGKWSYGRCVGVKRVTPKPQKNLHAENVKGILEAVEHKHKSCDEVETVRRFTYLGDRVSAGGGCEAAVTAIAKCGWIKFRECGELLHDKRFPLKLKGGVHKLCKASNNVWK